MVIKKKIFGFKEIKYIFEPTPTNLEEHKRHYSMISISSYRELNLTDFCCRHKKTPIIDLEKTAEEIFDGFNSTTRNEIRQSEKIKDLEFKREDNNMEEAYILYSGHEFSQGRIPERRQEFEGCKIFSAYYQNSMIAAIICFYYPGYLRAKTISSKRMENISQEMNKVISLSSRRLVWEICQYGQEHGYKGFDLGAINLTDQKKKGIAQFKQSFGPIIVDEYAYFYKSHLFKLFEKLVPILVFIKKIRMKLQVTENL